MKAGHAVGFDPDTLKQIYAEGYDTCGYYIGGSKNGYFSWLLVEDSSSVSCLEGFNEVIEAVICLYS